MLKLYNTLGKKIAVFRPVNKKVVTVFTCGPSVYQRAHIGNFRTFLFEDILVRYLEYLGYRVKRGMNLTDVEDKAIRAAQDHKTTLPSLTERNIKEFLREMNSMKIKRPDLLPRASKYVGEASDIIKELLDREIAYWYKDSVYFDPLRFRGFGKLYGLDMSAWPSKKKRFHLDTYPGTQWNLGDFILWHGYRTGDRYFWDTKLGRGRPAWNVQDASMISSCFQETLSVYCGGIDNLFRHHDYTLAILESVRPYGMARFWLHCNHLYVNGKKMSKSKGNILYADDLLKKGYDTRDIRFFLIYGHYRDRINYSDSGMRVTADKLEAFRDLIERIRIKASGRASLRDGLAQKLGGLFTACMDNDLRVKDAFDSIYKTVSDISPERLTAAEASGIVSALKEMDEVFRVIF